MKNIRTFIVKYVPSTESKPARILITDLRHKASKTISYHEFDGRDIAERAEKYLKTKGIRISFQSEGSQYSMLHTEDFVRPIK
jgi:hypothetical protein